MKVSLAITVFNEEGNIRELIDSTLSQTLKPFEIVIVDGGSTDKTVQIIREYHKKHSHIRLLVKKGSVGHGRNIAISKSRSPIVALIDGGCVAKKDWLQSLVRPFTNNKVDMAAGFYKMTGDSPLQKALMPFFGPKEVDRATFLPSARSMAIKKKLWEKVGWFSERLHRGSDDTLFNYQALRQKAHIVRVHKAIVYWEVPRSLPAALKKLYLYAKGDAKIGIWWHPVQRFKTHNIKIMTIFLRYLLGIVLFMFSFFFPWLTFFLIAGVLLYILWSIVKVSSTVRDTRALFWAPIVQISSDIAIMIGFIDGIHERYH